MTLKLSTWLLVALTGGAFVAGCGSSSNSTTSSQTTPTATVAPGSTTTSGTTTTTLPLTPAQAKQAVETCKHGVQAESSIPSSAKPKLEKTCEKAATGNTAAIRQVAEEACVLLVNASHIPAGAARERALAVCKVNAK
jgi:ABC-type phosphate transport system substrate-binding protein